jgi:hypothetical protein
MPGVSQNHALTASGETTTPTLGTPELTEIIPGTLEADPLTVGLPDLGSPLLAQLHALAAAGFDISPLLGQPALTSCATIAGPMRMDVVASTPRIDVVVTGGR